MSRHVGRVRAGLDFEADPGIGMDAIDDARKRRRRGGQTKAVRAGRPGENQRQRRGVA